MTERLQDTDQIFTPVIFDESETEFIMGPVSRIGFHFKEQVPEIPVISEGMKLEVTDEAMAGFVRDCLLYRDARLQGIIDSHHRSVELDYEYGRRRFSMSQHENMRVFIAKSNETMRMSQQLIGRLSVGVARPE